MFMLKYAAALSVAAPISLLSWTAVAFDTPDAFINDDGSLCAIMIASKDAEQQPLSSDINEVRQFIYRVLQSDETITCDSVEVEISIISVPERDAYGQPKWSSVMYLADFRADLTAIRSSSGQPAELEAALPSVSR